MTTHDDRFAPGEGNFENFPKILDFGLLLQWSDLGVSLFEETTKIRELDFCAVRNKRIFILDLLGRGFARGNTLPILRPFLTVKAIYFREANPAHANNISKGGVSVKRPRLH